MRRGLLILMAVLLLPMGFSFSETVSVTPSSNITTTTVLGCAVTATGTGTLQANITWYADDVLHGADNETLALTSGVAQETTSIGDLEPATDTTKNEVWRCQATIYNGTDTSVTNSSTITIQNSPPVVTNPTTNQTVTEDSPFGPLAATATDPDGDPIATWLSSDLNNSLYGGDLFSIESDGTIAFTVDADMVGNHTMAILASDGELFGGRNVRFEVHAVNDSPELDALTDQTATEGENFSYTITASDEEGDPLNFSMTSSASGLIINQLDATSAEITFQGGAPTFQAGGLHTVEVMVYENLTPSRNDTGNFTINVSTFNRLPNITSLNATVGTQGGSFQLNASATDLDINDTLNFSIAVSCGLPNPWTIDTLRSNASGAFAQRNVTTLSNTHIACRDITLQVRDHQGGTPKGVTNQTLTLNLTNTNDAPTVDELSSGSQNTFGANISNQTAPVNLTYRYDVDATDVDSFTYEGENLTYSDDTGMFDVNATTGMIEFTPTSVGNFSITITATDDDGLSGNRTLELTVVPNTFPVLLEEPDLQCLEDSNCSALLEASDPDTAENLTYTIDLLGYNTTSGTAANGTLLHANKTTNSTTVWKNFTNLMVGTYRYNITVTDRWGATDSQLWNITVNNTNDAPFFDNDRDNSSDTLPWPEPVVETHEFLLLINTTDPDRANTNETVDLSVDITGPNPSLFNLTQQSGTQWEVRFTPDESDDGFYVANFTLSDDEGANTTQAIPFSVYNRSLPPQIIQATPFHNTTSGDTEFGWVDAASIDNTTSIELLEAQAYVFNISWTDTDTVVQNVTVDWLIDGNLTQSSAGNTAWALQQTFDYFDAGTYTYVARVTDDRYEAVNFTWEVEVQDVNRPPQLLENLTDRAINRTTTITDYMDAFYDPDDDLDSNGQIDGSETNSLTFSNTDPTFLEIAYAGTDATFTPVGTGTDTVTFTATDGSGASVDSNIVTYNVTLEEDETTSSSGGGGGGGGSSTVPVPFPHDDEEAEQAIEIIVPKPLTIYYNDTIEAPIMIQNPTEDEVLRNIHLSAEVDVDNVTLEWTNDFIEVLGPGDSVNESLMVTNYRDPGAYEIRVFGDVEQPEVNDTAILYINSLEQSSEGRDVETRVTFARDLVASNPECIELNEIIEQAQRAIEIGQMETAQQLLDSVTQGCRYLVSEEARRTEIPQGYSLGFLSNYRHANLVLAGLLVVLITIAALLVLHYHSAAKREAENP